MPRFFPALVASPWAAAALVFLGLLPGLFYGFFWNDEPWLLQVAHRWAEGEVPYRDLALWHPPMSFVLPALVFRAFRPEHPVALFRIVFALQMALLAGAVHLLLRRHVRPALATLVAATALLWAASGFRFLWYTYDAVFWSTLSLLVASRAPARPPRLVASGALAACAALSKPTFLLAALALGCLALLRTPRPMRFPGAAFWSMGFALVPFAFHVYFLVMGAPHWWTGLLYEGTTPGAPSLVYLWRSFSATFGHPAVLAGVLGGLGLLVVAARWRPRMPDPGLARTWLAAAAALVLVAGLVAASDRLHWKTLQLIVIGLTIGTLAAGMLQRLRRHGRRALEQPGSDLVFGGAAVLGTSLLSLAGVWFALPGLALGLPAAFLALQGAPSDLPLPRPRPRLDPRPVALALCLCAVLGSLAHPFHTPSPWQDRPTPFADDGLEGIEGSQQQVQLVDEATTIVQCVDQPHVFVFPSGAFVYLLTDEPNPLPVDWWAPATFGAREVRAAQDLLKEGVPVLVFGDLVDARASSNGSIELRLPYAVLEPIGQTIEEEYVGWEFEPDAVFALPRDDAARLPHVRACVESASAQRDP